MTETATEELANVPVLATWTECRQISESEWSGMVDGHELRVRGTLPPNGEIIVSKQQKGDRMIVAGKIILEKAKG